MFSVFGTKNGFRHVFIDGRRLLVSTSKISKVHVEKVKLSDMIPIRELVFR